MEEYKNFEMIDLTSTSTQNSQNVPPAEDLISPPQHPEISQIPPSSQQHQQLQSSQGQNPVKPLKNLQSQQESLTAKLLAFKHQPTKSNLQTFESIAKEKTNEPITIEAVPESSQKNPSKPAPLNDKIFKIMEIENRPVLISGILTKVGASYDKKMIEKLMQELVEQGKLISKTYGKMVIYCVNNKLKAGAVGFRLSIHFS